MHLLACCCIMLCLRRREAALLLVRHNSLDDRGQRCMVCAEQVHSGTQTTKVDTWALGAILLECWSGQPPYQSSAGAMRSLAARKPPPVATAGRGLPSQLAAILQRCLLRRPRKRPSAHALYLLLRAARSALAPARSALDALDASECMLLDGLTNTNRFNAGALTQHGNGADTNSMTMGASQLLQALRHLEVIGTGDYMTFATRRSGADFTRPTAFEGRRDMRTLSLPSTTSSSERLIAPPHLPQPAPQPAPSPSPPLPHVSEQKPLSVSPRDVHATHTTCIDGPARTQPHIDTAPAINDKDVAATKLRDNSGNMPTNQHHQTVPEALIELHPGKRAGPQVRSPETCDREL